VKFAREGGRVTVRVAADDSAVAIVVEDDGAGIAPAFLPHIFDQFRQADSSMTREHGGLGLGLSMRGTWSSSMQVALPPGIAARVGRCSPSACPLTSQ